LVGMQAFRLAFVIALIVTVIELISTIYKMIRSYGSAKDFVLKVE
jgi:hypothetical protein